MILLTFSPFNKSCQSFNCWWNLRTSVSSHAVNLSKELVSYMQDYLRATLTLIRYV